MNDHHNEFINVEYRRALYVANGEMRASGVSQEVTNRYTRGVRIPSLTQELVQPPQATAFSASLFGTACSYAGRRWSGVCGFLC
jgi:hypothetical protein